ncbi:Rho-GTPase-activating protein RGD2 [Spathaspora sp. JA1]|nr:Rho-GTPase-activating protein RGD2 [Spathaspora sp. JA1]
MSFADSFWSQDYTSGFKVLFEQLHQGVCENDDFITLFHKRMESELLYGSQLESIESSTIKSSKNKRQLNDDYVSTIKNAYLKMNENFTKQGQYHLDIADNIKTSVLEPFSKWCKEHERRVEYSESMINEKNRLFKSKKTHLDKLQKRYFNKCRMLEECKSHYTEEELKEEMAELSFQDKLDQAYEEEIPDQDEEERYYFGNITYDHKQMKALLTDMLTHIPLISHKVAILGTYNNVSTGSSIIQWLIDNLPQFNRNLEKAEKFGSELINNGFIRLIGTMTSGKGFINSSQFYYQWKPLTFELTKLNQLQMTEDPTNSGTKMEGSTSGPGAFQEYFVDMKEAMGVVGSVDYSDPAQLAKLIKEVDQLDSQYYSCVVELDKIRCEYEELIMDHLTFMQKCELDRLKAIKKVIFDFLASFSITNELKQFHDELILLEETIHPVNDLKFLIENYKTGGFKPNVILYDNYYDSHIKQTFGVDLNIKSRLDKKVVPILIQCILSHLDSIYPDLEDDETRINLWTQPIHLAQVHKLRSLLNDNNSDGNYINSILVENHPLVITNVLKLYFMELPDSIVPHTNYDVIKLLYVNYPIHDESKTDSRINGLQNVLCELPKCNIATLDVLLTHISRLINIVGSKDKILATSVQNSIAKEFAPLVLRPKEQSEINDKHQVNFITDLLNHKDTIFTELRRQSSTRPSGSSCNITRDNSSQVSRANSSGNRLTPKENVAANSKSRLEQRLKTVVRKSKKDEDKSSSDSPTPATPTKGMGSLKRSSSPNKKRLSAMLDENNLEQQQAQE